MQPEQKTSSNNNEYLESRQKIIADLGLELVGPEEDPDMLLVENPATRYSAGMIFPFDYDKRSDAEDTKDSEDNLEAVEGESGEDSDDDIVPSFANSFFPSAMGLSFYGKGINPELKAVVEYATYKKAQITETYVTLPKIPEDILNLPEFSNNFIYEAGKVRLKTKIDNPKDIEPALRQKAEDHIYQGLHKLVISQTEGAWIRVPQKLEIEIAAKIKKYKLADGLELIVVRKYLRDNSLTLFTVVLRNIKQAKKD